MKVVRVALFFFLPALISLFFVYSHEPANGQTETLSFVNERSDINQDNRVDSLDLEILMQDWHKVTGPYPIEMVTIPNGSFEMGNTGTARDQSGCWCSGCDCEEPRHLVTFSYNFRMGKYEVTNAQYAEVLNWVKMNRTYLSGYTGGDVMYNSQTILNVSDSYCDIKYNGGQFVVETRNGETQGNHPVGKVSWYGAVAFCNWLSEKSGLTPSYDLSTWTLTTHQGVGYRLPSESEWEYACRGPASNSNRYEPFSIGDDPSLDLSSCDFSSILDEYMVWCGNGDGWTEEVGSKLAPHDWDVYDMHGNVYEWCQDRWHGSYDEADRPDDGSAWEAGGGTPRLTRGGYWRGSAERCRSARRDSSSPDLMSDYIGFRVVSDASTPVYVTLGEKCNDILETIYRTKEQIALELNVQPGENPLIPDASYEAFLQGRSIHDPCPHGGTYTVGPLVYRDAGIVVPVCSREDDALVFYARTMGWDGLHIARRFYTYSPDGFWDRNPEPVYAAK